MFFLATNPPQLPCSSTEPPNNTVKAEGCHLETLTLGRCNVDWGSERCPPLSSYPRTKWVSHSWWGCARHGIGVCLKQPTFGIHSWYPPTVHSTPRAGKWALVVTQGTPNPYLWGYGETTGCLKIALRYIFSLSHVCERHTSSHSLTMGDKRVSFRTLTVSWAPQLSSSPPLFPISASIWADVGRPRLGAMVTGWGRLL